MAMDWELIFKICNTWIVPFWLIIAFAPRTGLWTKIAFFGGVAPLAVVYAILLPLIMAGIVDPVGTQEGSFQSLAGVMSLLSSKGGATIGWVHYLAFDMLVGIWIARNADSYGIHRIIQVPILFFTLMAGPLGLVLYLIIRAFLGKGEESGLVPR